MSKKSILSAVLCFVPLLFSCAGEVKDLLRIKKVKDPIERSRLFDRMNFFAGKTSKAEFEKFDKDPKAKSSNTLLRFYDQTLDQVKKDIANTQVAPGTAAVWYLYNMGFIIKTPTVCFGVDIHHRRAIELAKVLDFLAVTHNHVDHYDLPLMYELTRMKKPVVSNFFPNPYYTKATQSAHNISGVTIHTGEADHNKLLKKFDMPMEFICPTGDKNFVFFTSGDCRSELFLHRKSDKIDLYAVHPICGMKPHLAAKKLAPEVTFIVHLYELSHDVNVWRWTIDNGRAVQEVFQNENLNSYIPAWGEKFIWDGKKITPAF